MNTLYSPPNGSNIEEIETIKQLKKLITKAENKGLQISTSNGESIALPNSVTDIFRTVINVIAQGKGISLIPVAEEVTTTQGAEILNISRPYLMRLIENGEIPYHQVGTHKRINLQDLLEYKKRGLVSQAFLNFINHLYISNYHKSVEPLLDILVTLRNLLFFFDELNIHQTLMYLSQCYLC